MRQLYKEAGFWSLETMRRAIEETQVGRLAALSDVLRSTKALCVPWL
jgi:hypothetical protein